MWWCLLFTYWSCSVHAQLYGDILPGNWTWITGDNVSPSTLNLTKIQSSLPAMCLPGVAVSSDSKYAFLFGGACLITTTTAQNFLYKVDLDTYKIDRISGSNVSDFVANSSSLQVGVPSYVSLPSARMATSMWFINNLIYVFGGVQFSTYLPLNDFWSYNLSSSMWTYFGGDVDFTNNTAKMGNWGTKRSFSPSNFPPARHTTSYWTDAQNNLWFYSGEGLYFDSNASSSQWNCASDAWKFDTQILQWAWMKGSSVYNGAYNGQSSAPSTDLQTPGCVYFRTSGRSFDGNLWVLGSGSASTSWLWYFNTSDLLWTAMSRLDQANVSMPYRDMGSIVSLGKNTILVFGGIRNNIQRNDLWSYFVPRDLWNWISGLSYPTAVSSGSFSSIGVASPLNIPPSIESFGAVVRNRTVIIFGGKRKNNSCKLSVQSVLIITAFYSFKFYLHLSIMWK
jgi:hypothetical protein